MQYVELIGMRDPKRLVLSNMLRLTGMRGPKRLVLSNMLRLSGMMCFNACIVIRICIANLSYKERFIISNLSF
jgi:hypothetical protein